MTANSKKCYLQTIWIFGTKSDSMRVYKYEKTQDLQPLKTWLIQAMILTEKLGIS